MKTQVKITRKDFEEALKKIREGEGCSSFDRLFHNNCPPRASSVDYRIVNMVIHNNVNPIWEKKIK
jgi:hypothetical protein